MRIQCNDAFNLVTTHCNTHTHKHTHTHTHTHTQRCRERDFLKKVLMTIERPVFALGRAQELCILLETFWTQKDLKIPVYFSLGLTSKVAGVLLVCLFVRLLIDLFVRLFSDLFFCLLFCWFVCLFVGLCFCLLFAEQTKHADQHDATSNASNDKGVQSGLSPIRPRTSTSFSSRGPTRASRTRSWNTTCSTSSTSP